MNQKTTFNELSLICETVGKYPQTLVLVKDVCL